MSSSNLVRIAYIEQVDKDVVPAAGDFSTMRKTSESLTGTPTTVESEEARDDRQSGGQVAVGLEVNGDINFELSNSDCYADFFRSGMKKTPWAPAEVITEALTLVASTGTITGGVADLTTKLKAGDLIDLGGFVDPANKGKMAYVKTVTASAITVAANDLVDEVGTAMTLPERLIIGKDDVMFAVEKNFLDLSQKTIDYINEMVDGFTLTFTYGEIATGVFNMIGAGYDIPDVPITDGRTVTPAETKQPLNASSDVGIVVIDGDTAGFCIQSLVVQLANNHDPLNCIGTLPPVGYSPGTAAITVTMNAYLADENFELIKKKLSLVPLDISYYARNTDGGFGVRIPAAQLSFPDPASGGKDQQVTLEMSGSAKPGPDGQSLYLYRLPAVA